MTPRCHSIQIKTGFVGAYPSNPQKNRLPCRHCAYAFSAIGEIIFAYDGSASAVFAIKQFVYLFPQLADKKVTVLQVNSTGMADITDMNNILALLQAHYSSIPFLSLTGPRGATLFAWLAGNVHGMVVMGAIRTNAISDSYRQNIAETLIKTN